jgi:hypothetical protein
MEDTTMYQLKTNNGITKTFESLTDAQEYCASRYCEMSWDAFGGNESTEWHGEPVEGEDDEHDVIGAVIILRHDDLEAWAMRQAEMHAADVRSMGSEPHPRDAENWEGLEPHERAAGRAALVELRDSEAA